jgi:hypothetical protein
MYGEVNVSVSVHVEIKGDYIEKKQSCFISVTLKIFRPDQLFKVTEIKQFYYFSI